MTLPPVRDLFADALSFPSLFDSRATALVDDRAPAPAPTPTPAPATDEPTGDGASSDADIGPAANSDTDTNEVIHIQSVDTTPDQNPPEGHTTDVTADITTHGTGAATTTAATTDEATTTAATTTAATTTAAPTTAATTDEAATDETASATVTFGGLGVPRRIVETLARDGITTPFPIQTATIPDALAGRDVLGRGRTGSGKTLAFGLPLIVRLAASGKSVPAHPKALILVPTRELAMQVNDAITPLARTLGLFSRTAVGGTAYDKQIRDLRRGVDIMVATPGRLGDLIERGECSLDLIEITVLDEADQMADMGFLPDVTALLEKTPARGQRMMFSATLDGDVDTLVKQFLDNPVTHSVDPSSAAVTTMAHHLLLIPPREKVDIIASIGARKGRTIMFVRTQMAVDRLAEQLAAVGVRSGALHGGKTQRVRTRTLAEFREGRVDVLVATDVAARGIHVDDVSLVVHIDPPKDSKGYLHRAGRTARAGESGMVVTLVMPRQRRSTYSMLERAGVVPGRTEVQVDSPALAELTGARRPSGVPVPMEEPAPRGRFDRGDRPSYGDRPRRAVSGDRPRSFGDRQPHSDRPQRTFTDRPPNGDRPRTFRDDRPIPARDDRGVHRSRDDRPHLHRPRFERSA